MKYIIFLLFLPRIFASFDTTWWKTSIQYEVFIWSFKDGDGDGIGDLKGITEKLDHFVDLKIKTLYLTPFFKSPMGDMGYDISNFTDVDPLFGTIHDFDELMEAAKSRRLKVICDLIINHSSDEHPWFLKSIDRIKPYDDFYIWANPKSYDKNGNPLPPNNWLKVFSGTAWTWNPKRNQFYYHQFGANQPDFNLRNKVLKEEIKEILKFWFDRGVAGWRLDAAKHYLEETHLQDEPFIDENIDPNTTYFYDLDHIYTTDIPETYEFIHELRTFVDNYSKQQKDYERILIAEVYSALNYTVAYYGTKDYPIAHLPYNFGFTNVKNYMNAKDFDDRIFNWLKNIPKGSTPSWMSENHDRPRIGNALCEEYIEIFTIMMMTLPGIACFHYGQEIGLWNHGVRPDQTQDKNNDGWIPGLTRDGERLPMQWDDSMNAGFTSKSKPWLPVNPNYWRINVKQGKSASNSRYNVFKRLSNLRKTKTLKHGNIKSHIISTWVYSFIRSYKNYERYITILNLGTETEVIYLNAAIPNQPPTLQIAAASTNSGYKPGNKIRTTPEFPETFVMRPLSAVVLTTKFQSRNLKENLII